MKKFLLIILAAGLLFSCQKNVDETVALQEVSFQALQVNPDGGLKSTADWICKDVTPTNAWIQIGNTPYYPELFILDGVLYTQAIKFPVGNYCVSDFVLYKEVNGTPGLQITDPETDIVVYGTPRTGSDYAVYVTNPLEYCFDVKKFEKTQVPIQVLCFQNAYFEKFGFNWFAVTEIVIKNQCFFGDLCVKNVDDYLNSHYALQSTGLQIDMPALFTIKAYKGIYNENTGLFTKGALYKTFTNNSADANWGVGSPVCVEYPDNLSIPDDEEGVFFELEIYVATGNTFGEIPFWSWPNVFTVEWLNANNEDVLDFVLGNCNLTDPFLQLPPYMNLPPTCTLTTGNAVPGSIVVQDGRFGYFDVTLSGIGSGFELENKGYGVNCFNQNVNIYLGTTYQMNVYNSLYPIPGDCGLLPWAEANYMMNHLTDPKYDGYTWSDVQQALWVLEAWDNDNNAPTYLGNNSHGDQVPVIGPKGILMYTDAIAYGANYVPLPGGWAAVAFANGQNIQCIFTRIDP